MLRQQLFQQASGLGRLLKGKKQRSHFNVEMETVKYAIKKYQIINKAIFAN